MNKSSEARSIEVTTDDLNELIIEAISDIKGKNTVKLDLRGLEDAPADFFIICEGDSVTQVRALGDNIKYRVKEDTGIYPSHMEGQANANWICVDYFSTVVHVFHPETRDFYALEELWSDAPKTVYEQL